MPVNITAVIQLQAPGNINQVASQIQSQLQNINATIKIQIPSGVQASLNQLATGVQALNANLSKLTQTANTSSGSMSKLQNSLSQTATTMNSVKTSSAQTSAAITGASNAMEEFGRVAGIAGRRFLGFTLIASTVSSVFQGISTSVKAALDFDRQFIKLSQVGEAYRSDLINLNKEISNLSKNFGVSSSELLNSAITLRQAGLSINDVTKAMEALAKASLSPSFDNMAQTTEGLIAIMAQFRIQTSGVEAALSSINAVANAYAVESKDILQAVQRTGGAFRSIGGDLNEFIALFTSVRSTTRESAESIATGLRTIFSRLQRPELVDNLKELGVNLRYTREEASALGNNGLEQQFVGGYEAVRRLSEALRNIPTTDSRYAQIVEDLGGYRQISKVIPLLQEFTTAQNALNIAQNAGSGITSTAAQAQGNFLVRISKLKEEFLGLTRTIVNSPGFEIFTNNLIKMGNVFTSLLDKISPLIPLMLAFASIKLFAGAKQVFSGVFEGFKGKGPKTYATGGPVPGHGSFDTTEGLLTPGEHVLTRRQVANLGGHEQVRMLAGGSNSPEQFSRKNSRFKVGDLNLTEEQIRFLKRVAAQGDNSGNLFDKGIQKSFSQMFPGKNSLSLESVLNSDADLPSGVVSDFITRVREDKKLSKRYQNLFGSTETVEAKMSRKEHKELGIKEPYSETKSVKSVRNLILPFPGHEISVISANTGVGGESLASGYQFINTGISSSGMGLTKDEQKVLSDKQIDKVIARVNVRSLNSQSSDEFEKYFKSKFSGEEYGLLQSGGSSALNSIKGILLEKVYLKNKGLDISKDQDKLDFTSIPKNVEKELYGRNNKKQLFGDVKYTSSNSAVIETVGKYLKTILPQILSGQLPAKFARGGVVPGQGNYDSVPADLTPGEFVIKKDSAQKIGYDTLHQMNEGRVGYARGGFAQNPDDEDSDRIYKLLGMKRPGQQTEVQKPSSSIYTSPINLKEVIRAKEDIVKAFGFNPYKNGVISGGIELGQFAPEESNAGKASEFRGMFYPDTRAIKLNNRIRNNGDLPYKNYEELIQVLSHETSHGIDVASGVSNTIKGKGYRGAIPSSYIQGSPAAALAAQFTQFQKAKEQSTGVRLHPYKHKPEESFADALAYYTKQKVFGGGEKNKAFHQYIEENILNKFQKRATGGSIEDTIPALLTPGEFVINRESASKIGTHELQNMNRNGQVRGYNKGGQVGGRVGLVNGGPDDLYESLRREKEKQFKGEFERAKKESQLQKDRKARELRSQQIEKREIELERQRLEKLNPVFTIASSSRYDSPIGPAPFVGPTHKGFLSQYTVPEYSSNTNTGQYPLSLTGRGRYPFPEVNPTSNGPSFNIPFTSEAPSEYRRPIGPRRPFSYPAPLEYGQAFGPSEAIQDGHANFIGPSRPPVKQYTAFQQGVDFVKNTYQKGSSYLSGLFGGGNNNDPKGPKGPKRPPDDPNDPNNPNSPNNSGGFKGVLSLIGLTAAGILSDSINKAAGEAKNAIGAGETGYKVSKGFSSAITGATIGASVGYGVGDVLKEKNVKGSLLHTLGGLAGPIGALGSAALSAASAFHEAESEIQAAKIEQAQRNLSDIYGVIGNRGTGNVNQDERAKLNENINNALEAIRVKADSDNRSFLLFRDSKGSAKQVQEQTRIFAQSQSENAGRTLSAYIATQARELGANAGSVEDIRDRSRRNFGSNLERDQGEQLRILQLANPTESRETLIARQKEQFDKIALGERARIAGNQALTQRDRGQVQFDRLADILERVNVEMGQFRSSLEGIGNLFEGRVSSTKINLQDKSSVLFGLGSQAENRTTIAGVGSGLGSAGPAFVQMANAQDDILRELPGLIFSQFNGNQAPTNFNETGFAEQIRNLQEQSLGGRGNLNTSQISLLGTIQSNLQKLDFDGVKRLVDSNNQSGLVSALTQGSTFTQNYEKITKIFENSVNEFAAGVAEYQKRELQIDQSVNNVNKSQNSLEAFDSRRGFLASGIEPSGTQGQLSVDRANAPLRQRAEYLANLISVNQGDAQNPEAIGRRQRELQAQVIATRQQRDDSAARGPNSRETRGLTENLSLLEANSARAGQALNDLANSSERNQAAQERLGVLSRGRSERISYAERLLTSSPEERSNISRGQRDFLSLTSNNNNNISSGNPEQVRNLISTLRTMGNIRLSSLGGGEALSQRLATRYGRPIEEVRNYSANNALDREYARDPLLGGFVEGGEKNEIETLLAGMRANIVTEQTARQQILDNQRGLQTVFFDRLNASMDRMFARMAVLQAEDAERTGQGAINASGRLLADATDQSIFAGNARNVGITSQAQVNYLNDDGNRRRLIDANRVLNQTNSQDIVDANISTPANTEGSAANLFFGGNNSASLTGTYIDRQIQRLNSRNVGLNTDETTALRAALSGQNFSSSVDSDTLTTSVRDIARPIVEASLARQRREALLTLQSAQLTQQQLPDTVGFISNQENQRQLRNFTPQNTIEGTEARLQLAITAHQEASTALQGFTTALTDARNALLPAAQRPGFVGPLQQEAVPDISNLLQSGLNVVPQWLRELTGLNSGGPIQGLGNTDTVPAILTPGEFVMSAPAVKAIGVSNLMKMNAQKFAGGGLVSPLDEIRAFQARNNGTARRLEQEQAGRDIARMTEEELERQRVSAISNIFTPYSIDVGAENREFQEIINGPNASAYGINNNPQIQLPQVASFINNANTQTFRDRGDENSASLTTSLLNLGNLAGTISSNPLNTTSQIAANQTDNNLVTQSIRLGYFRRDNPRYSNYSDDELIYGRTISRNRVDEFIDRYVNDVGLKYIDAVKNPINGRLIPPVKLDIDGSKAIADYIHTTRSNIDLTNIDNSEIYENIRRTTGRGRTIGDSIKDLSGKIKYETGFLLPEMIGAAPVGINGLRNLPTFNSGGPVPGYGSSDTVPALLTPGEFVLNKAATSAIGLSQLHSMNGIKGYNTGGLVSNNNNVGGSVDIGNLSLLQESLTGFITGLDPFISAMKSFPHHLTGSFKHDINLNINGAEAMSSLMPEIEKMIESQANEVLSNYISQRLYEAGPV